MEIEESGWTNENLLKLLASLKANIPKDNRKTGYRKELENVDWNEVALPPFSPEECREKWESIMKNIPKIRTLAELIGEAEDGISNPSHNTKIHPDHPKRPAPPNAVFFQQNFAQLKNEFPHLTAGQLTKISTERFNDLTYEEKNEYEEKHRLATEEYKTQMKRFWKRYGKTVHGCKKRQKKKLGSSCEAHGEDESGLPPKPVTCGYLLFCKEQSKSMGDDQKGRMITKWSKAWKKLSENEKMEYNDQCRELKREYRIKLNNYLKRFTTEEQSKILKENGIGRSGTCTVKNLKTREKLFNEPKMPSSTPCTVFFSEKIKLMTEIPLSKDRLIKASKMWKKLSSKEKERYKVKVEEKLMEYTVKLQKWFQDLTPENQFLYLKQNPAKMQYLDVKLNKLVNTEEQTCQPSDSEDEVLVVSSSSDEEGNVLNFDEEEDEEEEEEEEEFMFEMY